jgi:hypothetical protein
VRRAFPALLALLRLVAATPAHGASRQYRIFEDDRLLLYSGLAVRAASLDQARAMGVDVIRAQFVWRNIALSRPKNQSDPTPAERVGQLGLARARGEQARDAGAAAAREGWWPTRCRSTVAGAPAHDGVGRG